MAKSRTLLHAARAGVLITSLLWPLPVHAQPLRAGPVPPCGTLPVPAYPALDAPAVVQYWSPSDVGKDWMLPSCLGGVTPGFSTIVTTAARFHHAGSADSLLRRIGAISDMTGLLYWSPSNNKWQPLVIDAAALTGAKVTTRRGDFAADEIRRGDTVYFQQTDNLLGKVVFRLHVIECTPDRIVFSTENVNAQKKFFIKLFDAGEMQAIHFLDRESPDVWRYYGLVRTGAHTNGLVTAHPSSLINRAVAFFRYYAGIQADMEPPAAPKVTSRLP